MEKVKMEPQDPSIKAELEDTTAEATQTPAPQVKTEQIDPTLKREHSSDDITITTASPPNKPAKKKTRTDKKSEGPICHHCHKTGHSWSFCRGTCIHCNSKTHSATTHGRHIENAKPCPNLTANSPNYYTKDGNTLTPRQQELLTQAARPTSESQASLSDANAPAIIARKTSEIATLKREKEALFLAKDAAYQMLALKDAKIREKDREIDVLKLEKDALAVSRDAAQSLLATKEAEVKNLKKFVAPGVGL